VQKFDLLVLGTGPASSAASECAKEGWRVGIVDPHPVGGTCALRGCNPKKVLVRAAELADWTWRMQAQGVIAEKGLIDWPKLIRFKRSFTQPVTPRNEEAYAKAGITQFRGNARFTAPQTLEIEDAMVHANRILIATGATPRPLPIDGAEHVMRSDDFLEAETLPTDQPIVFIGGGYISFEFAHVAARCGAKAIILEMRPRPLERFDADLVTRLVDRSHTTGITIETNAKVERIERRDDGTLQVHVRTAEESRVIPAGMVVHGAGRVPNIAGLNLDAADIQHDEQGIQVNSHLRSVSNPAVYAAGDAAATGAPPLTPVASEDGRIASRNLIDGDHLSPDYGCVPSAVYSVPALAAVGLTEAEVRAEGREYRLQEGDWSTFNSMKKVGETHAMYKVLVDKSSDRILGAHLLGQDAAETINVFAMAMKFDLKATDIKSVLFTFPSFIHDLRSMV
jgi:glutathione reductase (NADPH)